MPAHLEAAMSQSVFHLRLYGTTSIRVGRIDKQSLSNFIADIDQVKGTAADLTRTYCSFVIYTS